MSIERLILKRATTDQWHETLRRQFLIWSNGVSEENFVARENALLASQYAQEKSWICWVLVERDDPESLDFKCSCETYRKPCLYRQKGYESETREGQVHAIASVHTPPRHQRKGYAKRMMQLLHTKLAKSLKPSEAEESHMLPEEYGYNDGIASVLFSDVGNFYAACMGPHNEAWQISNPKEIAWQVDEILSKPGEPSGRLEMRNLVYEDVEFLARTDMLSAARSLRPGTMQITYNAQDIDWHMIRARSLYDHFQPILHLPEYKLVGSQLEHTSSKLFAFILWLPDWTKRELKVLRLAASSSDQAGPLLRAAAEFAKSQSLTKIVAWNPDVDLLQDAGWHVTERTHSLPAIAWYEKSLEGVDWATEYYAWC